MNIIINRLKHLATTSLLLICGFVQGQTLEDSLTIKVLNPAFSRDTAEVNKNNRALNFTLSIKDVGDLKSIAVSLIDKNEKTIVDLGEYEVKKHERGFYYIEKKSFGKKTVFNNEIYFSSILKAYEFTQIKNIRLSYQSKSNNLKEVIAPFPNN